MNNQDQKPSITLAQWCAYLPYGLMLDINGKDYRLDMYDMPFVAVDINKAIDLNAKPLLHPLNKDNQAEINRIMLEKSQSFGFAYGYGFYCSDYEQDGHPTWYFGYELLNYEVVQALRAAHYDLDNLIPQGLALPIE